MVERYPGAPPGVVRLSQSDVETYLKCGLRYRFAKEEARRVTTVRMAIGSAVAATAREDNRRKIADGVGRQLADIVDYAVASYDEEVSASEVADAKAEVAGGRDATADAACCFGERVAPQLTGLIECEDAVVVSLGEDLELAGRPDYITADGLGDLKTGQPWSQDRADRSRQLTAYSLLHRGRLGAYPSRVWIDSIGRNGRAWYAQRLWSSRTDRERAAFVDTLRRVAEGIRKEIWLPAPEGAWWCARAWCPYWSRCPVVTR